MTLIIRKGFTLVEVLLAIFILGLGMVTSYNLFPLGLQSLSYARRLNEVYFLAEKKMEELKSQPNIGLGETSGKEKDLLWTIYTKSLKLQEGVELIYVELDIDLIFMGRTERQRFVTYLP
ncbi:MAG: prepilin-type N-terminal cleavage/methylation domain-containing protein [Candidatus Omnitrophica bacterium]|nr:prepilin-type N-terminal cleavage/methylation domain-containing protein [Candidatus Omnitrophota bacterium]MDD5592929.1 prepilin-type N-terminal cleavage/methylation domain-containing protein [Candidatus Omnitrophota bacterium]